jgi:hypothetical protein
VATALALSRRTFRTIRQNLGWAFGYNLVAIPLAAGGVLSPAACGVSMALSSVGVLGNSLRLARFSPRQLPDPAVARTRRASAESGHPSGQLSTGSSGEPQMQV